MNVQKKGLLAGRSYLVAQVTFSLSPWLQFVRDDDGHSNCFGETKYCWFVVSICPLWNYAIFGQVS